MPTVSVIKLKKDGTFEQENGENETQYFEAAEDQVIWDELDTHGTKLPHGCLSGSCGTCRILIVEGEENLSPASFIEQDTINAIEKTYLEEGSPFTGKKIRLSCRARVKGNITIAPIKS